MRAVVFVEAGRVRIDDVADPAIETGGDAVIRVTRAGICGSDLHLFHGKAPLYEGEGMGHEAVGVIESIGGQVRSANVGDRVVVSFTVACGSCWFCAAGQTGLCEEAAIFGTGMFGGSLPGAQAERLRVPHADVNLRKVPDGIDDERALFVSDVLTTGVYAADLAGLTGGETVAVIGAGPVGVACAQALAAAGPAAVFLLDRDPTRLAFAATSGATPIHVEKHNPQMALAEVTGDRGADVVIDAVGSPAAFTTALDVVRRGGRVVVVGLYAGETVEAQLGVYWSRGLDLRFAGPCPVHTYWDRAMRGLADGSLDPSPLVSHRLGLDEAQRGYELFASRAATKVVLVP